ncbi:MAG TPA: hypothetical protein PKK43_16330 [Spirochaetota bacterium]|nr:hypothetical protein [Spirochaetota bacterium]
MSKLCSGFIVSIVISVSVFAQSMVASEQYRDQGKMFNVSFVKGFQVMKSKGLVMFSSRDKALIVRVKTYTPAEIAKIAAKYTKPSADTTDVLKEFLLSQKIEKDVDPSLNAVPQDLLSAAKADAGSMIKYGMRSAGKNYTCRAAVYSKGSTIVVVYYTIVDTRTNEKYEKPANEMIKSFSFAE